MVQVVVANDRAALGPVPAAVNRTGVVRFEAHAVDFVELNEMIVAAERNGLVWRMLNQVVRNPQTNSGNGNGRLIHAIPAAVMVDVVILGEMPGWSQRLPISA